MKKHISTFIFIGIFIIAITTMLFINRKNNVILLTKSTLTYQTKDTISKQYSSRSAFVVDNLKSFTESSETTGIRKLYVLGTLSDDEIKEINSYYYIKYGFLDMNNAIQIQKNKFFTFYSIAVDLNKMYYLNNKMKEVNDEVAKIAESVTSESDIDKIREAADIICDKMTYTEGIGDIYSAVFKGKGVCNSYTLFYNLLLNKLGFETRMCFGQISGESNSYHTWTEVNVDKQILFCDITNYDSEKNPEKYICLIKSPYEIKKINTYLFANDFLCRNGFVS